MISDWHYNAVIKRRQVQVPWGLLWYVTDQRTALYKHDMRYALWFWQNPPNPDRDFAVSRLYDMYGNPAYRWRGRWHIDKSNKWARTDTDNGVAIFVKSWRDVQLCMLHHFFAEAA